ncbi:amino acid adenylation domain-containing protein [Paenibacillus alvei]|uniref:Amino acid adenylation domain-containing protein n=1 Tax=Paenibacillus alvei TaxID=44250 RepID=A0ABT4GVY3_PAEAL|nr:non-ribosomal peptide synthetase [Paenibacillus alvei]MCY9760859.1 amino acid adenylation domain-containing protein [Paenibacillus alvei]MCY9768974.1 amino acid adenylation domain-containing protein [Paenibacillus alvei]
MNLEAEAAIHKYELSHAQKRFWFTEQLEFVQEASVHAMTHVSTAFTLQGALNEALFKQAVQVIVDRHDTLRTCFMEEDGNPVQLVHEKLPFEVQHEDLSRLPEETQSQALNQRIDSALNQAFDLKQPPLVRVYLYRLAENEHLCLIAAHHIISDGWAVDVFMSELMANYAAFLNGQPSPLEPLDVQYADFAHWHNHRLAEGELDGMKRFWSDKLAGERADLNFPLDFPRPALQSFNGSTVPVIIDGEWMERLKQTCESLDVSHYMYLLAVFNVLLAKYTRNEDIIIGTSLSGRVHPDVLPVIGCFVNTLPVRNQVEGDELFQDFVLRMKQTVSELHENQEYPFDKIVEDLGVERSLSRNPIFDVLFEVHTLKTDAASSVDLGNDMTLAYHKSLDYIRFTGFDFVFELYQKDGYIDGYIQYNSDLFRPDTMQRLSLHFIQLLQHALETPNIRIADLDMLVDEEKKQVMEKFNHWKLDFPTHEPVQSLFEKQVEDTPDQIALSFEGVDVSYRELNERANRLAHLLRKQRANRNQFVAVMSERNLEWVTALIAIWKSGAAYVPVDPNLPDERLSYILEHSEAGIVITQRALLQRARRMSSRSVRTIVCLDQLDSCDDADFQILHKADADLMPSDNPQHVNAASDIAYMIYTSGSTGNPKGALVRHNGMINHLYAKITTLGVTHEDVIIQNASVSFDVSIWQAMTALMAGAQTSLVSFETSRDQTLLLAHLKKSGATIIETVPSMLFAFIDTVGLVSKEERQLPNLRWMIANGEELPVKLVNSWFSHFPEIKLINAYGPTECSDDVTQKVLEGPVTEHQLRIPIGRPLPNMQLYVMDKYHKLAPVGMKGEIWIGGIGVGGGYWKNDELTGEKFIPDPFSDDPEARIYRTGDLGRWLPEGELEFFSRIDFQVKIRGFRIELGEIEGCIGKHPEVDEVAVIVIPESDGGQALAAFYTSRNGLEPDSLRNHLHQQLPYYMVPAHLTCIPGMPLLASEKIDRHALRKLRDTLKENEPVFASKPQTMMESALIDIWKESLEATQIAPDDNFFLVGGHSISAVKVVNRIRDRLRIQIALQQIFLTPVLKDLAAFLDEQVARQGKSNISELSPILKRPPQHAYELAPVQLPEWYFHVLEPDNPYYNVSFDIMFEGHLQLDAFERAWRMLIERHSVLRAYFRIDENSGIPFQYITPVADFPFHLLCENYTHIPEHHVEATVRQLSQEHANQVFSFETGPLFSIRLVEFKGNRYFFLFATHHIIWDETSSIQLFKELNELYNAEMMGRSPKLADLEVEYTDYMQWINEAVRTGKLEEHRQYWLKELADPPSGLQLPTDFPRPPQMTFRGGTILGRFDSELESRVYRYCQEQGLTLNMFLLTVLNLQLYRLSNQKDFIVGSPIANRDDVRIEHVLGLFAKAMLLRCRIREGMSFEQLAAQVKKTSIEAYDNHLYPSNFIIEELRPDTDLSRTKMFSIMYGLQNNKREMLSQLSFEGLSYKVQPFDFEEISARFDLTYVFDELESGIEINLNYNTDLFKRTTAQRLVEQFFLLTEQVLSEPSKPLETFELVTAKDKITLLEEWNRTDHPYNDATCVHRLFEAQARRTPNHAAVTFADRTLSYQELNSRSNQLARALIRKGVRPENKVGILLDPSEDMIIALLAVLKSGGAYIPLNPDLPDSRRQWIADRTGMSIIISEGRLAQDKQLPFQQWMLLDEEASELEKESPADLQLSLDSRNLAYVMFTSGSTGLPKGIEIEHRGLVNLLEWTQRTYPLTDRDSTLLITTYTFDSSIPEIFWPLAYGARIVVAGKEERKNPGQIGQLAARHGVSVLQMVPIMLEAFVDARKRGDFPELPSLRHVVCGGAALIKEIRDKFFECFASSLSNHYGPTETSVDSVTYICERGAEGNQVPIGRPISNHRVYLLDEHHQLVPIGVPGELYIASPALARGYLADYEETSKRFIPNPFSRDPESRLYRTGDLAKYTEDGNLLYIGRVDYQVKVRGNRVEVEEVESRLVAHESVGKCAVLHVQNERMDGLVAYVELSDALQPFIVNNERLKLHTLAQIPSLKPKMDAVHLAAWPEFFEGDQVFQALWPEVFVKFPEYQFALTDSKGEVAAVGNTIPICWDKTDSGLPQGWDSGLIQAFEDSAAKKEPNTLLILAGVVNERYQGRGLASVLLGAFKHLAHGHKMERVIVPVRPTGKSDFPELSFSDYCTLRREDGHLQDNWLRTHERTGARMIGIAVQSQSIRGSISDWEKWTGRTFEKSGQYQVKGTLQPVHIDLEKGIGEYIEPSVWMEHPCDAGSAADSWDYISANALRTHLKHSLPDYMVPDQVIFVPFMPTTPSGKLDKKALAELDVSPFTQREIILPETDTEQVICGIWKEILQLERIGVTDNFFDLGGHSLLATQVITRISKVFSVKFTLRELYDAMTIRDLSRIVEAKRSDSPN